MLRRPITHAMLGNEDEEQDYLNDRSECCFDQDTRHLGHLSRELLTSEAQEIGHGYHRDVAQREDGDGQPRRSIVKDNRNDDERPKQVDVFCSIAARAPGDVEEM